MLVKGDLGNLDTPLRAWGRFQCRIVIERVKDCVRGIQGSRGGYSLYEGCYICSAISTPLFKSLTNLYSFDPYIISKTEENLWDWSVTVSLSFMSIPLPDSFSNDFEQSKNKILMKHPPDCQLSSAWLHRKTENNMTQRQFMGSPLLISSSGHGRKVGIHSVTRFT